MLQLIRRGSQTNEEDRVVKLTRAVKLTRPATAPTLGSASEANRAQECGSEAEQVRTCGICLDCLFDKPMITTPCAHQFHVSCLERWCVDKRRPTCPLCRISLNDFRPSIEEAAIAAAKQEERAAEARTAREAEREREEQDQMTREERWEERKITSLDLLISRDRSALETVREFERQRQHRYAERQRLAQQDRADAEMAAARETAQQLQEAERKERQRLEHEQREREERRRQEQERQREREQQERMERERRERERREFERRERERMVACTARWLRRQEEGDVPANLVTRAHRCGDCGNERCITERRLTRYDVSHYECECCGNIYDTFSRVPWLVPRL